MHDNAIVSWIVHRQPWTVEAQLIEALDLPLNVEGNEHHVFCLSLKAIREEAAHHTKELPVLPNPGVGVAYVE